MKKLDELENKSAIPGGSSEPCGLMGFFRRKAGASGEKAKPLRDASMQLELRCRERLLFSINSADLPEEGLTVGKAPDNTWVVPDYDRTCAPNHARIFLHQSGIRIVASEGKFIHVHGEPVKECFLKKNERAAIGDSELFVKSSGSSARRPCDVHRLETVGGEHGGEMVRLAKSPFRIGSAPDNDLVLDSDVVSAHHAEVRITENGETWLKDLHSSNGTFVNGERLGRQERMLMDSDELAFAHFDYLFLDRNVVHTRSHFGRKMLIMGATLLVVLAGFGVFYLSSPSAEMVINAVDFYLLRNNYDAAERVLARMPDSRGFQQYEKQYREYLAKIPRYRHSFEAVRQFQEMLARSEWREAAESFGKLELNNPQAWNQSDPATAMKISEITRAKKLLDILFLVLDENYSPNTTLGDLSRLWDSLEEMPGLLEGEVGLMPPYLKPLGKTLLMLLSELKKNITTFREIDVRMEEFSLRKIHGKEFADFMKYLDRHSKNVSGVVRVYVRDLTFLLNIVRKNITELRRNDLALFDLRLNDIKPVALIPADDCMKIPQLYRMRQRMGRRYQDQLRCRDQWRGIQGLLARYNLKPGVMPGVITLFSDADRIERIFSLPGLKSGDLKDKTFAEYEALFGTRYFYEVFQQTVHSVNNVYASDLIPDARTVPRCVELKDLYRGLSEALTWSELPRNQWFHEGKMKEYLDYYRQLLETRPRILKVFTTIAGRNKDNRQYFLARTMWFFLALATPDVPAKMTAFGAEWRKFRIKQQELVQQYDAMDPAKSRRIRDMIVSKGIPGDPVFNWMRSSR